MERLWLDLSVTQSVACRSRYSVDADGRRPRRRASPRWSSSRWRKRCWRACRTAATMDLRAERAGACVALRIRIARRTAPHALATGDQPALQTLRRQLAELYGDAPPRSSWTESISHCEAALEIPETIHRRRSSPRTSRCCGRRPANPRVLWPELDIRGEAADGLSGAARDRSALAGHRVSSTSKCRARTGSKSRAALNGRCHVVFVTAYDKYAVAAFEQQAADYILKPYSRDRLAASVAAPEGADAERSRQARRHPRSARPSRPAEAHEYLRWITASQGQKVRFVTVDRVCYFQADNKYTHGDDARQRAPDPPRDQGAARARSTPRSSGRSTARRSSTSTRSPTSRATSTATCACTCGGGRRHSPSASPTTTCSGRCSGR